MTEILVSDGGSCNLSNSHNLINLIKDFQNYYYLLLLCSFFLSPDDGSDNLSNLSNYAFFQLDNYYYYYKKENSTYSMFNLFSSHSIVSQKKSQLICLHQNQSTYIEICGLHTYCSCIVYKRTKHYLQTIKSSGLIKPV